MHLLWHIHDERDMQKMQDKNNKTKSSKILTAGQVWKIQARIKEADRAEREQEIEDVKV